MKAKTISLVLVILLILIGAVSYVYFQRDQTPPDMYQVESLMTDRAISFFDAHAEGQIEHFSFGGVTVSRAYYRGSVIFYDTDAGFLEMHFPYSTRGSSEGMRFAIIESNDPYEAGENNTVSGSLSENPKLRSSFYAFMKNLKTVRKSEWDSIAQLMIESDKK